MNCGPSFSIAAYTISLCGSDTSTGIRPSLLKNRFHLGDVEACLPPNIQCVRPRRFDLPVLFSLSFCKMASCPQSICILTTYIYIYIYPPRQSRRCTATAGSNTHYVMRMLRGREKHPNSGVPNQSPGLFFLCLVRLGPGEKNIGDSVSVRSLAVRGMFFIWMDIYVYISTSCCLHTTQRDTASTP